MIPKPHAIVFDLDGTLLDTLGDIAAAANHALSQLGQPTHPTEAYRMKVGHGSDVLMQRALPPDRHDLLEQALRLFKTYYTDHLNDRTRLYPGITEMLDALAARHLPLGVLSNKPEQATRACVQQLLGRWRWSAIAGHREDTPKKPDPTAALRIAHTIGVAPDQCWLVGDSDPDMQTATRAGMRPIGVTWGYRDRQLLIDHGADRLIDHPAQLLDELDSAVETKQAGNG